jgi:tripartite-type tricarboxylate transporter receptor subunit TctC
MVYRIAVVACLAASALLYAAESSAQTFPSRPVRIIVPVTAGGLSDLLARQVAQEFTQLWGQQVFVENRPGANTILAAEAAAKAAPDGYTLMLTTPPAVSINQFLFRKLPYDPERDLAPVFNIAYAPPVFIVGAGVPVSTLQEFVALAKSKPGELAYGSFGVGSVAQIDIEVLSARAGMRMNHIPYKGIADVLPALVSGLIQFGYAGIPPVLALIRQGRIKALAVGAPRRIALLPDVPTLDEAGFPGLDLRGWFGIVAPAATPRSIIDKIAADLAQISARPEFRSKSITGVGLEPMPQLPDQFAEFLKEERARNALVIRTLNLVLD